MSGTIASASAPAAGTGSAGRAGTRINADFDMFLTLLTTQLRNQDPTRAMDAQQMTQQLVQFAGVEQQIAANQRLERLIALQEAGQLTASAPLIGRWVEVESDRLSLQGGEARLRLPAAATAGERAVVSVLDAQGRLLLSREVRLAAAPQEWRWDGRDAAGRPLPDGAYAVRVSTTGSGGETRALAFSVIGRATAAERRDGQVQLRLGALAVGFDKLRGLAES
ncbi:MAG: flagellar hook assembly protein FlgD [Roseococcus sp.]|nr:flagellar hook assembly protein FlgD [Roseococcus sp.]